LQSPPIPELDRPFNFNCVIRDPHTKISCWLLNKLKRGSQDQSPLCFFRARVAAQDCSGDAITMRKRSKTFLEIFP